jgi:hypothetical protein
LVFFLFVAAALSKERLKNLVAAGDQRVFGEESGEIRSRLASGRIFVSRFIRIHLLDPVFLKLLSKRELQINHGRNAHFLSAEH